MAAPAAATVAALAAAAAAPAAAAVRPVPLFQFAVTVVSLGEVCEVSLYFLFNLEGARSFGGRCLLLLLLLLLLLSPQEGLCPLVCYSLQDTRCLWVLQQGPP